MRPCPDVQQQHDQGLVVIMDRHMEMSHPVLALSVHRSLLADEHLGHLHVAVLGGQVQRREAILSGSGQTGTVLHQDGCHLLLPLLGGDVERRVEVLSDGIHYGPRLEQGDNNVHISKAGGNVKRSLLIL